MAPESATTIDAPGARSPSGRLGHQAELDTLFELEPEVLRQLLRKAAALAETGRTEQAERLLRDLASFVPRDPSIPWMLGELRLQRGQAQLALEALGEAIARLGSDAGDFLTQLIYLGRARALILLGAHGLAEADLMRVTEGQDPELARYAYTALEAARRSRT